MTAVRYLLSLLLILAWVARPGIAGAAPSALLAVEMTAWESAYAQRKSGFDPSPREVREWTGQSRQAWVDHVMANLNPAATIQAPTWTGLAVRHWGHGDLTSSDRSSFGKARQAEVQALRGWWFQQMSSTRSPLAERMVLLWHNAFVVAFSGMRNRSDALWQHHQTLRQHAVGNYRELLGAMIRDPALLIYLDNTANTAKKPNENFARELFEIFTLGDGHYTEHDIREAARALSGWHVSRFGPLRFEVNPRATDHYGKTIFNRKGRFDGDDLVELILSQPASAEHLVKQLWNEFVSNETPDPDFVAHLSGVLVSSDYAIRPVLKALLSSESFWDPRWVGTSVKPPVELIVGALRSSQRPLMTTQQATQLSAKMGQVLFDPPNVSGWGYGEYWLEPSLLVERDRALDGIAEGTMSMSGRMAMQAPATIATRPLQAGTTPELLTRELVLSYFTPARDGQRLVVDAIFDGLVFQGRRWDFFGVSFGQDKNGEYLMTITRDRCRPACLSVWPIDARDRGLKNFTRFYLSGRGSGMMEALPADDSALVKALLNTAPAVLARVLQSPRMRTDEQKLQWSLRMQGLLTQVQARFGDQAIPVRETGEGLWLEPPIKTAGPIQPADSVASSGEWSARARELGLASDLSGWMLSTGSTSAIQQWAMVIRHPAFQIK
ncbi:DUF1800 family protein [Litorivicinus lipolyticus]|uniref:DUF1800 family protein n=1 Tax=Litorivicinus lipolyticus TaxID=418701 RepID=A0A5Q2QGI9_9GAMM|nr:DUF1800 domain-containing protein [Litorivicinus lipolyticus]QGG80125.1 DUF1800 family protein [Litorivicinus lipolyticus]